jgi:hypothetical protein
MPTVLLRVTLPRPSPRAHIANNTETTGQVSGCLTLTSGLFSKGRGSPRTFAVPKSSSGSTRPLVSTLSPNASSPHPELASDEVAHDLCRPPQYSLHPVGALAFSSVARVHPQVREARKVLRSEIQQDLDALPVLDLCHASYEPEVPSFSGDGRCSSRHAHSASERSVEYSLLMNASVAS